jgi:DSBA-like thioredoxin domain
MLHIDIWADFACPACYLAKPRIDQAIAASGHADAITVTYRSLELFPDAGRARRRVPGRPAPPGCPTAGTRAKLATAVKTSGITLTQVFGIGPVNAGTIIGD